MGKSRKHLTVSTADVITELKTTQHVVKSLGSRGDNLFEVQFPDSSQQLVLLPAKFNKAIWVRRGAFLIVQQDTEEASKGKRISGSIDAILTDSDIAELQTRKLWPAAFKDQSDKVRRSPPKANDEQSLLTSGDGESDSGMSPLKPNLNRPVFEYEEETDSDST